MGWDQSWVDEDLAVLKADRGPAFRHGSCNRVAKASTLEVRCSDFNSSLSRLEDSG